MTDFAPQQQIDRAKETLALMNHDFRVCSCTLCQLVKLASRLLDESITGDRERYSAFQRAIEERAALRMWKDSVLKKATKLAERDAPLLMHVEGKIYVPKETYNTLAQEAWVAASVRDTLSEELTEANRLLTLERDKFKPRDGTQEALEQMTKERDNLVRMHGEMLGSGAEAWADLRRRGEGYEKAMVAAEEANKGCSAAINDRIAEEKKLYDLKVWLRAQAEDTETVSAALVYKHVLNHIEGKEEAPQGSTPLPIGLSADFPIITPEALKKKLAEGEQDREDKRHLEGKYAPAPGFCIICKTMTVKANRAYTQGDPFVKQTAYIKDWSCTTCGVMYKEAYEPAIKQTVRTTDTAAKRIDAVWRAHAGQHLTAASADVTPEVLAGSTPARTNAERSKYFSDTCGGLGYTTKDGPTGAHRHPDRCICQGNEATPHKHYDYPPYSCARCGACKAYEPAVLEPFTNAPEWRMPPVPDVQTAVGPEVLAGDQPPSQKEVVEKCSLCGCEWLCPDCHGVGNAGERTPAINHWVCGECYERVPHGGEHRCKGAENRMKVHAFNMEGATTGRVKTGGTSEGVQGRVNNPLGRALDGEGKVVEEEPKKEGVEELGVEMKHTGKAIRIGQALRRVREELGITMGDVAGQLAVSVADVSNKERDLGQLNSISTASYIRGLHSTLQRFGV